MIGVTFILDLQSEHWDYPIFQLILVRSHEVEDQLISIDIFVKLWTQLVKIVDWLHMYSE